MKIYKHMGTGQEITEDTYDSLDLYDKIDYDYYGDTYTIRALNSFDEFVGGDFRGGGASGEW